MILCEGRMICMKQSLKKAIAKRNSSLYGWLIYLFLYLPIIIIIIFSFNTDERNIRLKEFTTMVFRFAHRPFAAGIVWKYAACHGRERGFVSYHRHVGGIWHVEI